MNEILAAMDTVKYEHVKKVFTSNFQVQLVSLQGFWYAEYDSDVMHGKQAFNLEFKAYEMKSYHGSAKHSLYMLYEPWYDIKI